MKLSIITINYNNLQGLEKTYQSVVSQTWQEFEWIVIDGGSTDGSKELLEEHQDKFSYWVSEPDKGIYNAMNKGIGFAIGERVLFLNSGDFFVNDSVLDNVFKQISDADVVYGNVIIRNNDGTALTTSSPNIVSLQYLSTASLPHQATFYKRTIFSKYIFQESYTIISDWLLSWQLLLDGFSFSYFDCIVAEYNTEGISSKQREKGEMERIDAIEKYTPDYLQSIVSFYRMYSPQISFVKKRRILKKYSSLFYKSCIFVDKVLSIVEKCK